MQNRPSPNRAAGLNWFFPSVDTVFGAREAAKQGIFVAGVVAVITGFVSVTSLLGFPTGSAWGLVDTAAFAVIALGIYRMSRLAALTGLVLFVTEQALAIASSGTANVWLLVIVIVGFANAVRGTFAYQRLQKQQDAG